ncbi:nickel ABC transporter permease [Faecalispora anaeroviscerum]|uniref:nickel ABC transporter permease n=1 Tax=Faecalispora anaeroviscerum TaxID=2991836 RepID=UPI0024BB98E3|nr:nickel ABC transporter permease [Faecalispora anaeroviscerum]
MHKYIFKRILMMIPVVIGVSLMVFMVLKMTPGDPARVVAGSEADEATVMQIREELGLNKPVLQQYVDYMAGMLHGDMGNSYTTGKPVFSEILSRMPTTFTLAFAGVLVAVLIGIPLGIISATKQYSVLDNISTLLALTGVAMPNFWLGLMLILVFALQLGWLPSGGVTSWQGYILPAVTLGVGATANFMRTTRSSMLEVIRQDYIRTVRAKGANEKRVILHHALRNALIPVITVIGLQIGTLLGGAVVNETVFSLPGVGMLMINSINKKDEPVVLGCLITFAIVFSLVNLFVDILYAYIDPRIKSQYR